MKTRAAHRILGLTLALPLVVWMATGLLFHVKHRYGEAYETLRAVDPAGEAEALSRASLSPSEVLARGGLDRGRIALHVRPGAPVYLGRKEGRGVAVDASSGEPLPPADEPTARLWLRAALSRSPNAGRYGEVALARETVSLSSLTGGEDPAFLFETTGGKRVTVDRVTAEIAQAGDLNDFIDLTYRLHYLQWTPWKPVNIALVLAAVPLVLALAATGLFLALRGPRRLSGDPT
jgi:uncharacterized iron-regulated membrane protein